MKYLSHFLLIFIVSGRLFAQEVLPRSSPEAQKVDPQGIVEFLQAMEKSEHEMHSIMVLRNGQVIAESWWNPYGPDFKHTMYSVSKSFTATAIGLAVGEGRLSVQDKVISFFPHQLPDSIGTHLKALNVQDLLTMSVGHVEEPTGKVVSSDDWVKSFLKFPIPNPPGTSFLYNTAATYMLSAIVQKVSGRTLMDYLRPRLFEPLGIAGVDWESDPNGINTGGYGLRLKTEDMAKFGQLFLQGGQWQGKQLLPLGWVEEASTMKIMQDPEAPQEKMDQSDWLQGYGYQMWRSRYNSFRADGAFGQYILILPELDAVIVITSETKDMQGELNLVWEHLLPAFDREIQSPDPSLKALLHDRSIAPLVDEEQPAQESLITGQHYEVAGPQHHGKESFSLDFKEGICELEWESAGRRHRFLFGSGKWVLGETDKKGPYLVAGAKGYLGGLAPFKVAGSYRWIDENTLELQLRYIESPHTEIITVTFDAGGAMMEIGNSFTNNKRQVLFDALVAEGV